MNITLIGIPILSISKVLAEIAVFNHIHFSKSHTYTYTFPTESLLVEIISVTMRRSLAAKTVKCSLALTILVATLIGESESVASNHTG